VTLVTATHECGTRSIAKLVRVQRIWVTKILANLLELGGFTDVISWDGFLYVLLRFCSLSKLELCQVMFYIIARDVKSWTVHYITTSQLAEFYEDYEDCPMKAFNTGHIEFASLPMARYRLVDFIAVVHSYSQLINPCLHLQSALQQSLPSRSFWRDYDRIQVYNCKITLDFFRYEKSHRIDSLVHLSREHKAGRLRPEKETQEVEPEVQEGLLVKRSPALKADMPCPLGNLIPPRPPRTKREFPPPLPAWMSAHLATREDDRSTRALAKPAVHGDAPWEAEVPVQLKSLEDLSEAIYLTYGSQKHGSRLGPVGGSSVHADDDRKHELEFIRRSRRAEPRRDNIVSIMERRSPCELIERPIKKFHGHT